MKQELVDRIYQAAPKLYGKKIPPEDSKLSPRALARQYGPCYLGVADGWFRLLMDLSIALDALDEDIDVKQVKEKFGTLRFYVGAVSQEAHNLIDAAEELSEVTCEVCGEPGELRGGGWISALCDEHSGAKYGDERYSK